MIAKIKLLESKIDSFYRRLEKCDLCPRNCRINRLRGKVGYCGVGDKARVYTSFLHLGEEPPLSASNGSGTIFFSGCSLKCIYCQNYKFSHFQRGREVTVAGLTEIMLNLQKDGAHNINLVTPTHLIAQILNALLTAYRTGLSIPVVYNTSGYEKPEIIESLEGIVDIYLPDIKYISASLAKKYSQAADYSFYSQESIKVMYQQKPLAKWQENVLLEGLIVRHLLLPGYTKETRKILFWLNEFTPQALLSIMFQYQPYYRAKDYPELNRKIKVSEYKEIKRFLADLGIRGWVQSLNSQENLAGVYFKPDAE